MLGLVHVQDGLRVAEPYSSVLAEQRLGIAVGQ